MKVRAAMQRETPKPLTTGLTVSEFAERYRIGVDKVHGWIRRGELKAVNVASVLCGRPRWVILPDAIAEFEKRRTGGPEPQQPKRRRKTTAVDYYPD